MKISDLQLHILTFAVRSPVAIEEFYCEFKSLYTKEDIALNFHRLFIDGSLGAVRWDTVEDENIEREFIPTLQEIHQNIDLGFHFLYFLTQKGIDLWEEVAQPKWDQYFTGYFNFNATYDDSFVRSYDFAPDPPFAPIERYEGLRHYAEMYCLDKKILEKLLEVNHLLDEIILFIPGTEVWDVFKPWNVNYWKTLPSAHRVTYQFVEVVSKYKREEELSDEEKEARAWFKMISKWHLDVYQG